MSTWVIVLLGAVAGLTIYLGLPLALLPHMPPSVRAFASMLATGVLLFLLYDVLSKASEPIAAAVQQMRRQGGGSGAALADIVLLASGLALGLLGLVYFNKLFISHAASGARARAAGAPAAPASSTPPAHPRAGAGELSTTYQVPSRRGRRASQAMRAGIPAPSTDLAPQTLALIIAGGIGLHNFSEGLAIGQAAASGALSLAAVLIIGFGLHNMTEGFGIAGPLTGQPVSRSFIGLAGLIGGGPTFLGTVLGIRFYSPQLFIFCLALAAGAIIYVLAELFSVAKRFRSPELVMWGLLTGFLLGYTTDLLVTVAGA